MVVDRSIQIAAIEEAISSGATTVSYDGKQVSYRSLKEMFQVLAYLKRQQARADGGRVANVGLASFDRGYARRGRCG